MGIQKVKAFVTDSGIRIMRSEEGVRVDVLGKTAQYIWLDGTNLPDKDDALVRFVATALVNTGEAIMADLPELVELEEGL